MGGLPFHVTISTKREPRSRISCQRVNQRRSEGKTCCSLVRINTLFSFGTGTYPVLGAK